MKKFILLILITCIATTVFASGRPEESTTEIIVFAAASTTDIITEAGDIFTGQTGVEIKLNPASSGTCARQLERGAFADIFISASENWILYVDERSLLSEFSPLMNNSLVVIAPLDSETLPFEIKAGSPAPQFEGRLSIADPEHAPAGKYAVEALNYLDWYSELSERLLPGADVRKALSVVEFGESDIGIVYKTDAEKSSKVKILAVFPAESHSAIRYLCGLTKESTVDGKAFYDFLTGSRDMAELVEKYGFSGGNGR